MTPPTQHTAEPWHVSTNQGGPDNQPAFPGIRDNSGLPHGEDIVAMPLGPSDVVKANAARIVTCINALSGIPDPAATLKAVREALDNADTTFIRYAEMHFKKGTPEGDEKANANLKEAEKMRAALALLTPNQDAKV